MPQNSALYAVARIRALEAGLFNKDRLLRLMEGGAKNAMKQLSESGYGSMPDAGEGDLERMIANELAKAYAVVRELSTDPVLTDVFLIRADVINLKLLIKLRILGADETPAMALGGLYLPEQLARMVQDGDYSLLPAPFRNALEGVEAEILEGSVKPQRISVELDKAYIWYALQSGREFAIRYFSTKADFDNLLTLLRSRAMGLDAKQMENALLPAGSISHERLIPAYDMPIEDLADHLSFGEAAAAIRKGLEEASASGTLTPLERERDNYLLAMASRGKGEIDTIAPVIGYLLAREQEARCIRLIITAARNSLNASVIEERLREVYG